MLVSVSPQLLYLIPWNAADSTMSSTFPKNKLSYNYFRPGCFGSGEKYPSIALCPYFCTSADDVN